MATRRSTRRERPARPSDVTLHDPARWPMQAAALAEAKTCKTFQALLDIFVRTSHSSNSDFEGVALLAEACDCEREWWSLLAYVADLALQSEALFGTAPLHYLGPNVGSHVSFSRKQAASLLALAFFDAIPAKDAPRAWDMHPDHLSFRHWLSSDAPMVNVQKALCLVQFFQYHRQQEASGTASDDGGGMITIHRLVLSPERLLALDLNSWLSCDTPLQPLTILSSGAIEEADGALQADFANQYIGGGVLDDGNVQEEIRFSVCPECFVSMLVCARMEAHEAIVLAGVRQYASYSGYGGSFECTGAHEDVVASTAQVVALDATPYYGGAHRQYYAPAMLRELTKLWAALSADGWEAAEHAASVASRPFATGNWGCGVFGGDLRLKAMLQWLGASRAGRALVYYPFGDPRAKGLAEVSEPLLSAQVTVGQLARVLFDSGALTDGGALDVALTALQPMAAAEPDSD